ncbi:MAG: tRNA (adenosine(37)-N6)-threonylcarbamoyltransferase complex ATPase subunit type 1 TsaE [Thalassobaculum sp.]|uniref:tRNA (adenosine(37)-N6)-threonylcarbamoyltransferase complex ATPase subunit type 1 TsaE n=1 Tax=Thalassobaculum sp. TaxID=2022740 RepID=UPI0032EBEFC4
MTAAEPETATIDLPELAATERLAGKVAALARPGEAVLLSGPLGAGKSAFARAFVRAWLGDPAAEVPSPTFTLVQPYDGPRGSVWHCDLYRLGDPDELAELGIEQGLAEAVLLVEWPDRLGPWVPVDRLELALEMCQQAEDARRATLVGFGGWAGRIRALAAG